MNQAQHIWLAIMTGLAISRCKYFSPAMIQNFIKHTHAAELDLMRNLAPEPGDDWNRYN